MITYKTYTISTTQIPDRKSLVIKVSEDSNNKELNFQELKKIYRENCDGTEQLTKNLIKVKRK